MKVGQNEIHTCGFEPSMSYTWSQAPEQVWELKGSAQLSVSCSIFHLHQAGNEGLHTFPNPLTAAGPRLHSSPGMVFSQELSVPIPGDSCEDKVKGWLHLGPSCPYQMIQKFHVCFIPTRTVGINSYLSINFTYIQQLKHLFTFRLDPSIFFLPGK